MTGLGRGAAKGLILLAALAGVAAGPGATDKPKPAPNVLPLPPAEIDDTLLIGGKDVEGRKVRSRMTVAVEVNGQGPFRFVVDSGADTSVIGADVARRLQLPAGTPVTLHGTTASTVVGRVAVERLGFGQSAVHDLELPVLHERDLGAAGLIGIDALVEQRLMLDFDKRVIRVEDARKPAARMDGDIVVVARRRRGQLILTQARANGRPVEAVIDTGSEITIGNLALRDRLMKRWADRFTTIAVSGVTGMTVNLQLARVPELRLGAVILRDVPVAFADVPPFKVFGMTDQPALLLGTDLMETFRRVSLDFRARKVRFQLRGCRERGVGISTSTYLSRLSVAEGGTAACSG